MTRAPGRLVLVGHPVAHSLSPALQNAALRHAGLQIVYEAIDVPPAELDAAIPRLIAARAGGNVTIPHKEAMAGRCARLDAIAQRVGAVNTFRVGDDGALEGTNTDVGGFDTLARGVGALRANARVAVLGYSIVGVLAIEYGRRCPRTVSHVITAGTPPTGDIPTLVKAGTAFFDANASEERKTILKENYAKLPLPDASKRTVLGANWRRLYGIELPREKRAPR